MDRFNAWLAASATQRIGTMWCCYVLTTFCLLPVLFPQQRELLLYVSNCMQLVFLPLIMVGNSVLSRSSEQRAAQDHEAIMAALAELKKIDGELDEFIPV